MEITKVKVEPVTQKFANKEQARNYFGFAKKSARTFSRYLEEFKVSEEFGEGYINPTGGYVLIDIEMFEEFLRWKSENKFRRCKE